MYAAPHISKTWANANEVDWGICSIAHLKDLDKINIKDMDLFVCSIAHFKDLDKCIIIESDRLHLQHDIYSTTLPHDIYVMVWSGQRTRHRQRSQ